MRYLFAMLLGIHGIAHLVGFAVAWQMIATPEQHYKTTVLGGLADIGDTGPRFVGLIWLATALACMLAGAAIWEGASWGLPYTTTVLVFSVALCLTALPEARIGLLANVAMLTTLAVQRLVTVAGPS
jgi:hypothetical protein